MTCGELEQAISAPGQAACLPGYSTYDPVNTDARSILHPRISSQRVMVSTTVESALHFSPSSVGKIWL